MDDRFTGGNHAVDRSVLRPACRGIDRGRRLHFPAIPEFLRIILDGPSGGVYYKICFTFLMESAIYKRYLSRGTATRLRQELDRRIPLSLYFSLLI
jgi:hypothetical protein